MNLKNYLRIGRKYILKKYNDFDKNKRSELDDEITVGAHRIGIDDWWDKISPAFSRKVFGLCSDCENLRAVRTKYDRMFATCYIHEFRLDSVDPVEECNSYSRKGEMDINDMTRIAIILEPFKRKIGFES